MTCEYCGKYISNNLSECPYCGAPNPVYKKLEDEISKSEKEIERLKSEIETRKLAEEKEQQEIENEVNEIVKMSAICSIFTAFITVSVFSINHNIDYVSMLLMFYTGNSIGNAVLFAVLSGLRANKIVKLIFCAGFMILGCLILK